MLRSPSSKITHSFPFSLSQTKTQIWSSCRRETVSEHTHAHDFQIYDGLIYAMVMEGQTGTRSRQINQNLAIFTLSQYVFSIDEVDTFQLRLGSSFLICDAYKQLVEIYIKSSTNQSLFSLNSTVQSRSCSHFRKVFASKISRFDFPAGSLFAGKTL